MSYTPREYVVLPRGARIQALLHRRGLIVAAAALSAAALIAVLTTVTGAYEIGTDQAFRTLVTGEGGDLDRFIVLQQRLPRVVAALLVGMALGTAGAIFQSLSRNPLGSPDIIGFTTGAATGGLLIIVVAGAPSGTAIALGTLFGGGAAALAVVLASLRGGLAGDRLVLSGIAVAAMLAAVNDYLLSRSDIEDAEAAKAWQHGSLNAISWHPVVVLAAVVAISVPVALAHSRTLRTMELGDDSAAGVGIALTRARLIGLTVGVILTAVAVATAGPIGFLALAAPQLARRIARTPGVTVLASASMGALLLVVADLAAQRLLSPFQIPVGLVTSGIGGAYLVWLLVFAHPSRG